MSVAQPNSAASPNATLARPGDHIGALDGLRGLAALWVFLSHVQILTGMRPLPVIAWGDSAVDLFMMISGFLMAHHYLGRASIEPWRSPRTWFGFWLRRLFRIAPAYYLLLLVALVAGAWLGECRAEIGTHFPWTLTRDARYNDHSLANVAAHLSFVFGAVPRFAFSTPLPDWSIGLEMQFYLVMPFLMLLLGRRFSAWRAVAVLAGAIALELACRGYGAQFDMPSFLPMKLTVFLVGMLCAYGVARENMLGPMLLIGVIALWALIAHASHVGPTLVVMAACFPVLVGGAYVPGLRAVSDGLTPLRRMLSSRAGRWAGDFAYSLYLIHLMILIPIAAALARQPAYLHLGGGSRFLIAAALTLPISLGLSALVHVLVERPGITMGKAVVRRLRRRGDVPAPRDAVAAQPAAPRV